jgi:hypothetical protein
VDLTETSLGFVSGAPTALAARHAVDVMAGSVPEPEVAPQDATSTGWHYPPGHQEAPGETTDFAEVVSHAIPAVGTTAAAIGGFVTLWAVLDALYPGVGAILRALTPLGLEAAAGHALISGYKRLGWPERLTMIAVIALCVVGELTVAYVAPGFAQRKRVDAATAQVTQALQGVQAMTPTAAVTSAPENEGKRTQYKHEANNGKALDNQGASIALQGKALEAITKIGGQHIKNARQTTAGEAWIPMIFTILGAIGSAVAPTELKKLIRALSRWRRKEVPRP